MKEFVADVCSSAPDFLGECCRWDEVHSELMWVNQSSGPGQVYRAMVEGTRVTVVRRYELPGSPSAFAPLSDPDQGWIVAMDQSLVLMDREGSLREVAVPEAHHGRDVHTNDGAADPWGRFWIGSMGNAADDGLGSLYRYDAREGLTTVMEGLTISNGIAWSPDRATMYHVDSGPGTIRAYDVDESGELSSPRVFAQFDVAREGTPDGICLDENGALWVAVWGGYEVRHYSPQAELLGRVRLDTAQPSSCALGGPDGTTLYITTAQEDMSAEQLAAQPHAGRLFCASVGVRGLPLASFDIRQIRTEEQND